ESRGAAAAAPTAPTARSRAGRWPSSSPRRSASTGRADAPRENEGEKETTMKNPMQLRAALALAAIVLSARAGVGEESKTSAHATIRRMHEEWVAAGKTRAASVQPKFGIDNVSTVNLHAYQFQANTSTDLINDDGNGYRYFGAPAVPFMAAPL